MWTKFPIDYTHIHTDLKTTSVLDHFIVNERLLSVIEDCGVMHFGDNPSRHSPIMIKLRLDNLPVIVRKPQTIQQHPAWYKANVEDIDSYTENLHSRLSVFHVPKSLFCNNTKCSDPLHSLKRDSLVLDVMSSVIESTNDCILLSSRKSC